MQNKILIVYYSRKGENYWNGEIKNLAKGNTEAAAEIIAEATGGRLFEVETVKPYPADYYACTEAAKKELRDNARPELKSFVENMDGYSDIFVGYPNWWGTMPMAMFAFLGRYDMSGKRIMPFCTNEGSGMGNSERDLKKLCPGAKVERGLAIHGAEVSSSRAKIEEWLKSLGEAR
ncbi:flavodoxin [Cloacibacillus sp. An23]|uniref:flavodoxin n=1 Tax=Cloacibacillus sp. An23 TaxID=1965591 RepID=UPI000B3778F6|nr:flavodoxin [Cloacibacillus sp. An23]OUO91593.1 flavodoxin [Cloacibacillus sp. An23]